MDFIKKIELDFGSSFQKLGYKSSFQKSGFVEDYSFICLFDVKNYLQFTAIICDTIDENFIKIPKALLAINKPDTKGGFTFYFLDSEEPTIDTVPHTRNIYFYCNETKIEKKTIINFFAHFNLRAIIRDKEYFEMEKPDFFICHDSRDKEEIAKPLFEELVKNGYKVWYDEFSLKIGDSLTDSIQKGITSSKKGIVILSKNFLSNERWVKFELQSFVTRQITSGEKIILPIWHKISEKDLENYPWLLDKIGGNTKNGISDLVENLKKV